MSTQPEYAPRGSAVPEIDGPGDAELISAVRAGDINAYGVLFARHADAARRLGRQLVSAGDVDDLVSEAFAKVLGVLQRGGGPDLAFRAYLLTSMRRLHVDKLRAGSRLTTTDDLTPYDPGVPFNDTVTSGFENATAAKAFASLPERWQQVLWHTEVEGQKPADIAPLLGMSANSVSALAYRAREGLRQAFVTMHANDAIEDVCATVRGEMGAYIRGGTSRRTSTKIEEHLGDCRECTAIYLELTEVNSHLGAILAPALLGTVGAGYLAASHGVAAKGLIAWLLHNPAGRTTAAGGGIAAAAAVAAVAVAASSGSQPTVPAAAPPAVSTHAPAPAPPAPKPPVTTPQVVPVSPRTVAPAVTPPTPPVTTPTTTPPAGPVITQAPVAATAASGGTVVIDLFSGVTASSGGLHLVGTPTAGNGTVIVNGSARWATVAHPRTSAGTITYTANAGWKGVDTIHYVLGDSSGQTVTGTVQVTTLDAAPVAAPLTAAAVTSWTSTSAITIDALASATDANPGDVLTISNVSAGAWGTARVVNGRVKYTPRAGIGGKRETLTYIVSDGTLGSAPQTITITLGQLPDRAPVASDLSIDTLYASPVSFDLPASDPDGDPLTVSFSGGQAERVSATGLHATYTPPAGFSGTTSITYTVSDGRGMSASGTITATVAPAPVVLGLSVHHVPSTGYVGTHFNATGIPAGKTATFTMTITGFSAWRPGAALDGAAGQGEGGSTCSTSQSGDTMTVTCTVVGNGDFVHADFIAVDGWSLDAVLTPNGYDAKEATIHRDTPPPTS